MEHALVLLSIDMYVQSVPVTRVCSTNRRALMFHVLIRQCLSRPADRSFIRELLANRALFVERTTNLLRSPAESTLR